MGWEWYGMVWDADEDVPALLSTRTSCGAQLELVTLMHLGRAFICGRHLNNSGALHSGKYNAFLISNYNFFIEPPQENGHVTIPPL